MRIGQMNPENEFPTEMRNALLSLLILQGQTKPLFGFLKKDLNL